MVRKLFGGRKAARRSSKSNHRLSWTDFAFHQLCRRYWDSRPPRRPLHVAEPLDRRMLLAGIPYQILVVDPSAAGGDGAVIAVDPTTGMQSVLSSGGNFVDPTGIAVAKDGNIYVSDLGPVGGTGAVIRVNPVSGAQTVVSSGGQINRPNDITIDTDGSLLVADTGDYVGIPAKLFRVDSSTGAQTLISSAGAFISPTGVVVNQAGDILVIDKDAFPPNFRGGIFRVDRATGIQTTLFNSPVSLGSEPARMVIESAGTALASNIDGTLIFRVNLSTGSFTTLAANGLLSSPSGVVIAPDGRLIVANYSTFGTANGSIVALNTTSGAQSMIATGGKFVDPFGVAIQFPNGLWDGDAGDNQWTTAANWSNNTLPGPADDVIISVAANPTIQLSSGTQTINSLICDEALTLNGGTLSVAAASTIIGSFTLSSGTLTGDGDVFLSNASNSWTDGTMSGSGKTIIASGGTLNASGTELKEAQRPFDNLGTVNVQAGKLRLLAGGTHSGPFNVSNSAVLTGLEIGGNHNFQGTASVSGLGYFEVSGFGGTSTLAGSISVGLLSFFGGNSTFNAPVTASTWFLAGGIAAFNGATTLGSSTPGNAFSGGTMGGLGDVTITGTVGWTGGTMSGTGRTIIANTGTLNITGGGVKTLSRTLENNGTMNWSAGDIAMNGGTIDNKTDAIFNATATARIENFGGTNAMNNAGTVAQSVASPTDIDVPFNTSGTVTASGTLQFFRGGATTGTATFNISGGLVFAGLSYNLAAGASVSGPGELHFEGGTHTVTGSITSLHRLAVLNPGSSVNLLGPVAVDIFTVTQGGNAAIGNSFNANNVIGLGTGGNAIVNPGTGTLRTGGLSVDPGSTFDLTNNAMVIDYTAPAAPLNTVIGLLMRGYNGGTWTGDGLTSSSAGLTATDRALGYAEATNLFTTFPATFGGQQVDNTSILIRYTLYGDANLDRSVNLDDFTALAANFGQPNRVFSQGNFDYSPDGVVNLDDFTLLAAQFGKTLAAPSDVPRAFARTPISAATPQAAETKFSATRIIDDVLSS